jgi:hypothetical protein
MTHIVELVLVNSYAPCRFRHARNANPDVTFEVRQRNITGVYSLQQSVPHVQRLLGQLFCRAAVPSMRMSEQMCNVISERSEFVV